MERYALIERDGVVNVLQDEPVRTLDRLILLPFVIEAFHTLRENGIKAVIVTCQEPLANGEITAGALDEIHGRMRIMIEEGYGKIEDIMVCPSLYADWERCRFPKPRLLHVAAAKHGFKLQDVFFICSGWESMQAGWAAGCKTAFVKTGKPFHALQALKTSERQPDIIQRDLLSAVIRIIRLYSADGR
ncbi:MAG: hypothetical protein AB1656_11160 [Candidatus Omnitrophota bacterium]